MSLCKSEKEGYFKGRGRKKSLRIKCDIIKENDDIN